MMRWSLLALLGVVPALAHAQPYTPIPPVTQQEVWSIGQWNQTWGEINQLFLNPVLSGVAYPYFDVTAYGAKCDGSIVYGGVTVTANSPVISTPSYSFTQADVGAAISLTVMPFNSYAAGTLPSFSSTIQSVSGGVATMAANATFSSTAAGARWYHTVDTAAIQAALVAANGMVPGGGWVAFPAGVCATGPLTLYSNDRLTGASQGGTTLMLANNTNATMITGASFNALTGTNSTGGVKDWAIQNIQLDGNRGANSGSGIGASTAVGDAIKVYGYEFTMDNVLINNFAADGVYTEWSTSAGSPQDSAGNYGPDGMEAHIHDVKCAYGAGWCFVWNGPHDSVMNNITTISMGTGGILNYPAANGSPLTISYYHGYQEPIDLNLQTAATCIRCFSEGTSVLNNYDYTIIGGLFNTLQIGTNSGPTVYNLSVADTSVSTLNNLSGSGFQDQWSNSIVSATSGNTYAPSTSINNRGLANVLSGSLELYNGASYPAVFAQSGGSAFTFTNSGGLQWTNSSGVNTYTGAVVSPTLYGGNNATITYSGSQGGYTAGQYTLLSASNLAGGVSSGVVNASAIIVNDDTVNAPGSAVSWLNVFGNVGTNAWTASTAYGVGTNANNGGRIYQVTSAGTSAGSGGPSGTGSAITDGGVTWKYVSADFSGDRVGIQAELNILSPNDPATPNDSSRQWQAMLGTTTIHANQGGTGFNGNSAGFLYGGADQMWAYSGATYLSGVVGRETDVGIQTGASAVQRTGMQVVSFYNVRGNYEDDGYRLASVGGPGFSIGYEISGGSAYAISSTGTLFGYLPPEPGTLAGAGVSQVNPISALGVDLSGTEQTVAAIRTTGGTLITGAGVESIQSLKVSTSGTTVSVDAVGYELASATISNAGTGYNANDHLYEPVTGSIVQPVSVNGSGVISSLFVVTPGHYTGTAPTNPVTLLGGTGTGATAALSWTQATTLALSPSGGVTSVGGDFLANSASALATGATQGFLHLPHTTGAPTGTPANTTPGCEWNTSSHTLNCYDGSAWYHFTGTSGAG